MFDKSKLMIMVTGTTIEPWDQNWKECESTWIPELRKLGYTVMVAIGNPNLETEWKIDGDMIWFKAEDTKRGLYDKSIRLPIDWILSETDYEYYFRIDSDSFVHPSRFDWMITENLENNIPEADIRKSNENQNLEYSNVLVQPNGVECPNLVVEN